MKKTMSTDDIANDLISDEYAGWTRAGAYALAEYLEQMEEDSGTEMEYDRVAIRCDYSEYAGLRDWADQYFGNSTKWEQELSIDSETLPDDVDEIVRDYITDHGQLIEFDGGIIVSQF